MDDARTENASHSGETAHVVEKRVDQCSTRVPGRGMHDQTRRLVDDQEIAILVQNVEGEVLWFRDGRSGRGNVDRDLLPASDPLCRAPRSAVHQDLALGEERLDSGPAQLRERRGERPVETSSAGGRVKSEFSGATQVDLVARCGIWAVSRRRPPRLTRSWTSRAPCRGR
jgi:hypothetical protein